MFIEALSYFPVDGFFVSGAEETICPHCAEENAARCEICGGYSSGVLSLVKSGNIYVYVGGQGSSSAITGGFNGGGSGIRNGRGGGGASDIRIGQDSLYSRAIVAGGGGGSGVSSSGSGKGVGGGTSGLGGYTNETTINGSNRSGGGGTQTEGGISWKNVASTKGSFGQGGNAYSYSCGGGGGGRGVRLMKSSASIEVVQRQSSISKLKSLFFMLLIVLVRFVKMYLGKNGLFGGKDRFVPA